MEDGRISDGQITASSFMYYDYPRHGRLNRPAEVDNSFGGWCPHDSQLENSWIRVDLGVSTLVAGVIMQGRGYYRDYTMHWVSKYKVQYSNDDFTWQTVMDEMVREIISNKGR